jgi:hypothetical protein
MDKKTKKKILIISDLNRGNFNLARKILLLMPENDTKIIFYSENRKVFLDGEEEINDIDNFLLSFDLFFNLLPVKEQMGREIERKIKSLSLKSVNNNLNTRLLFFSKNNLKKLLKSFKIKSPVFSLLDNRIAEEIFSSFPQPSRIFSKSNKFFSGKIDSIEKINKVFEQIGPNHGEYIIEEYIEGEDLYALIFRDNGEVKV